MAVALRRAQLERRAGERERWLVLAPGAMRERKVVERGDARSGVAGRLRELPEAAEVLELSDPMPSLHAPIPEPQPQPHFEPEAEPAPAPQSQTPPQPAPSPQPTRATAVQAPMSEEPILSNRAAAASLGSLETLSKLLVKPEPESEGTLEGLVREMLRPMLREWLDAHLPEMVETMVAREIAKITSQMR